MKIINKLFDLQQGRKYQLFFVSLAAGVLCFTATYFLASLSANLPSVLAFISGLYALYCGGNVVASWVGGPTPSGSLSDNQGPGPAVKGSHDDEKG